MIVACGAVVESSGYKDGVYTGEYSFVKVRVKVKESKISEIEILRHGGGGKKYEDMVKKM